MLCGGKSLAILKGSEPGAYSVIKRHTRLFRFGTQGPDILFYCVLPPYGPELMKIGKDLHTNGPSEFLRNAFELTLSMPAGSPGQEAAFAYLAGFLSHCALDRAAHPYVYYRTGFDENGRLTKPYNEYHRRFEADIDTILCKRFSGKTPYEYDVPNKLFLTKTERQFATDMFTRILNGSRRCGQAGYMMRLFYAAARDKIGLKKTMAEAVEQKITGGAAFTALMHKNSVAAYEADIILNESHKTWRNPWNGHSRTESFVELFGQAAQNGADYMRALYDYIYGGDNIEHTLSMMSGGPLDGGPYGGQFKYHCCIYQ